MANKVSPVIRTIQEQQGWSDAALLEVLLDAVDRFVLTDVAQHVAETAQEEEYL